MEKDHEEKSDIWLACPDIERISNTTHNVEFVIHVHSFRRFFHF